MIFRDLNYGFFSHYTFFLTIRTRQGPEYHNICTQYIYWKKNLILWSLYSFFCVFCVCFFGFFSYKAIDLFY